MRDSVATRTVSDSHKQLKQANPQCLNSGLDQWESEENRLKARPTENQLFYFLDQLPYTWSNEFFIGEESPIPSTLFMVDM